MLTFSSFLTRSIHPYLSCCVSCSTCSWWILHRCSGSWTILPRSFFGRRGCERCPHNSNSSHCHIKQCFSRVPRGWSGREDVSLRCHVSCFWRFRDDVSPCINRHEGHVEILNYVSSLFF